MPLLAWLLISWLVSLIISNDHALLFLYVAVAALIYLVPFWLAFRSLGVQIVEWVAEVSGGAGIPFSVALNNRWPLPLLNLKAQIVLENAINRRNEIFELNFDVNPFTNRLITRTCAPLPRGKYRMTTLVLTGRDLFGLVSWKRTQKLTGEIRVFPTILPLSITRHPGGYAGEWEEQYARSGAGTIPEGIRNYSPGDNLARIHWKASARRGKLLSKEFGGEPGDIRVIIVGYGGNSPEENEALITAGASLAWAYYQKGLEFYFLVYDRNEGDLGLIHTREDMERLLGRLTVAVPKEETVVMEGLAGLLVQSLKRAAGKFILLTGTKQAELPENLQRTGYETVVVSLPPDIGKDRITELLEGIGPC